MLTTYCLVFVTFITVTDMYAVVWPLASNRIRFTIVCASQLQHGTRFYLNLTAEPTLNARESQYLATA